MMSPLLSPPTFCLVEAPGLVKAASFAGGELAPGAPTSPVLGVEWADLVRAATSTKQLSTALGPLRVEALLGADGEVTAVLIVGEESARRGSTIPPASTTRVVIDLDVVAGNDHAAQAAVDLALRLAKTPLPIYIAGEEGAGAEALARAMVEASGRGHAPLFYARVGAPESSLSELLARPLAELRGATVLVDDLHELDVEHGRALAREIDRGVLSDAQFIGTGRADLRERVLQGTFARELHTLVRSSTVTLPALRDREDKDELIEKLCAVVGRASSRDKSARLEVSSQALEVLRAHVWPGNLRELASWLERAAASAAPGRVLKPAHFPLDAAEARPERSERKGLRQVAERGALEEALRAAGGNVSLAAKKLGVARSTLYRMKQRHNVEEK